MTQIEAARQGSITEEMRFVAAREELDAELIGDEVARGRMVIPANKVHLQKRLEPMGIGIAAKCKINAIRQAIIDASPVPIGTVPIYQLIQDVKDVADITPRMMLDMVEHQASQGVDYMTIHAGVLREYLPLTVNRVTGIVSRGGSLMGAWMLAKREQNAWYTHFDELCEIMQAYDVTI